MTIKSNGKVLVVGSANTDMVISANQFPKPGETIFGHSFMTNFGGKGSNQAVAAARLGGDTTFICKVGSDTFGTSTIEMLRNEGINIEGVSVAEGQPSGVALITVADGENSIIVGSGANSLLSPEDIQKAESLFADASIVLMQLETPVDTLTEAAKTAKKYGAYVVLNPAPAPKEPLPAELLENVDLYIPNETEASVISGVEVTDEASISAAMDKIQEMGVKDVIITAGSRGVYARINGKIIMVPAFKVKAIDTTAAGDTFCGALCVSLAKGNDMEYSMRFGCKASSITVTRKGAQLAIPRLEEVVL